MRGLLGLFLLLGTLWGAEPHWPSPEEYRRKLHVGIDVNWALFPGEIEAYSAREPRDFRKAGFDHIRIRFKADYRKLGMTKEAYFRHLDRIVGDVLDAGMTPILAFGAEAFKRDPSRRKMEETVAWWDEVARRYRKAAPSLSLDLIIEPAKKLKHHPERLNEFYERALVAIRRSNPRRIVMIAPPKLAQPRSLKELKIPSRADGYLMVETHFYAAGPSPDNPRKRWTTGTPQERALLERHLDTALAWQRRHGIPIWIGAIMPGDYNKGDHYSIEEQVHFATFISCLFRHHHVPFAINADQKFYDYRAKRWRKDRLPVLQAILSPRCAR